MNWWEVAKLDRSSWKAGKCKFVHDAVRCWGGPKPLWKKAFVDNLTRSSMWVSSEMGTDSEFDGSMLFRLL